MTIYDSWSSATFWEKKLQRNEKFFDFSFAFSIAFSRMFSHFQNNLRINATKLNHEIEELQRRVDDAKMKLTGEVKVSIYQKNFSKSNTIFIPWKFLEIY